MQLAKVPVMMKRSGRKPEPPLHAPLQLPTVTQLPTQLTGQQAARGDRQAHGAPSFDELLGCRQAKLQISSVSTALPEI
jgi:hypothetical protein